MRYFWVTKPPASYLSFGILFRNIPAAKLCKFQIALVPELYRPPAKYPSWYACKHFVIYLVRTTLGASPSFPPWDLRPLPNSSPKLSTGISTSAGAPDTLIPSRLFVTFRSYFEFLALVTERLLPYVFLRLKSHVGRATLGPAGTKFLAKARTLHAPRSLKSGTAAAISTPGDRSPAQTALAANRSPAECTTG